MVLVKNVLVALEQIAFTGKTREVKAGLKQLRDVMRASSFAEATTEMQDVMNAHVFARELFEVGADIVTKGMAHRGSARTIRHRLMTFSASRLNHRSAVPCVIKHRAVVNRAGVGRLEPIGLVAQDTRALIAYAFWTVAPEIGLSAWRRYKTRKCTVCGGNFRDLRTHLGGGVRKVCSDECRNKQNRHDKKKRKRR